LDPTKRRKKIGVLDFFVKTLFWIPDHGVKKALDPRSGSATVIYTIPNNNVT
jgi:hypothetical protein